MRQSMKIIMILSVLLGITAVFAPTGGGINPGYPLLAAPQQDNPDVSEELADEDGTDSYFMNGVIFVVGLALLWFLFYKLVYPFLLKYYHPSYCKKLFWSLLLLYGLAWIAIGSYILFEFGFRIDLLKWVFVFIGVIWIIWFLVIILKKDEAYY